MTQRRAFTGLAAGGRLALALGAMAQPSAKVWRIGLLAGGLRPADGLAPKALRNERLPAWAAVLSAKRLEMIKERVPATKRVAVLWGPGGHAMSLRCHAIERPAQQLQVSIEPFGVREPDDFGGALAATGRSRPDALMMVSDAPPPFYRWRIVGFAATHCIAAMYEAVE